MEQTKPTRLIVGITGATGTIFGVRMLQMLHGSGVETHLVVSKWAARTLTHETPYSLEVRTKPRDAELRYRRSRELRSRVAHL